MEHCDNPTGPGVPSQQAGISPKSPRGTRCRVQPGDLRSHHGSWLIGAGTKEKSREKQRSRRKPFVQLCWAASCQMWAISLSPSPKGDVGGKLMHLDIKYLICHYSLTATGKWFKPELTSPGLQGTEGGSQDSRRWNQERDKERRDTLGPVVQMTWLRFGVKHGAGSTGWAVPTPECVPESHCATAASGAQWAARTVQCHPRL